MLLVKTYIGPSEIHGFGLYAGEDIKKGDSIWQYNQITTQIFWKKQFLQICSTLSYWALKDFITFSYLRSGSIYYVTDRTRFINHSLSPNIAFKNDKTEIAVRDIKAGEEITENYLLSYDTNDFFHLNFDSVSTKEELIQMLSDQIQLPGRPNSRYSLNIK